jgi:hypothetical protein
MALRQFEQRRVKRGVRVPNLGYVREVCRGTRTSRSVEPHAQHDHSRKVVAREAVSAGCHDRYISLSERR